MISIHILDLVDHGDLWPLVLRPMDPWLFDRQVGGASAAEHGHDKERLP
jgi:hypothetical protein